MRGAPIWQVIAVLLMFAAAGVPVRRLTAPMGMRSAASASVQGGTAPAATALEIRVSFAPAPTDFALRYLGETTVLSGEGPAADFTGHWTVTLPAEGVDLTLQARWPEATPGHVAAHVTLRFPDGRETTRTFWGEAGRPMVEVVTVTP